MFEGLKRLETPNWQKDLVGVKRIWSAERDVNYWKQQGRYWIRTGT